MKTLSASRRDSAFCSPFGSRLPAADCPPLRSSRFGITTMLAACLFGGMAPSLAPSAFGQHYQQTNLVSDVPGLAAVTDANLVNAWGLARSATSPWWVSDNGTGLSTLYTGAGVIQSLVVAVPPSAGQQPPSAPTGAVFNGSADFAVAPNAPARFLFATEDGTIAGWSPVADPANAITMVDHSGSAVYKGLTLAQNGGANYLYAANFFAGTIDVYDRNFAPVDFGRNAFRDPHLPRHFSPFNVQAIGTSIYVAYAEQDDQKFDEVAGAGRGFVDVFTTGGVLQMRLRWGRWMNAPWGLALAPAGFGRFSNMILVGQFGSGKIAAFDPATGHFRGLLRTARGRPLVIEGLWALVFGNGASAGPATSLFFSAGPDDEAHGLFGTVTPLDNGRKDGDNDGDDNGDDD